MAERHPGTEHQQALGLDDLRRRLGDPEPAGSSPNESGIAHRVGGSQKQQPPGIARQIPESPREVLLDLRRKWQRGGQAEAARQLRRRQPAGHLQQRKRISARLNNQPLHDRVIQTSRQHGLQQRPRIATVQALDPHLRQSGERVAQLARREQQRDLFRQQAASYEHKRARRRTIEPLRVIDGTQQRPLFGGLGHQTENRQPDQERVRGPPTAQTESDSKRVALGGGEALIQLEDR